jgi:hypothetical protein
MTARDDVFSLFQAHWNAETLPYNGGNPVAVEWQGVDSGAPPGADTPWARITMNHNTGQQTTLGGVGSRRFTHQGIIVVQVFSPVGGFSIGENLAIIGKTAFQGQRTTSGVWFRNVRVQEIGFDGTWNQTNVVAEFEYDDWG